MKLISNSRIWASMILSMAILSASAAPVTLTYSGTISSVSGTAIAGVTTGGSAEFAVTMDNGGSGLASQTWNLTDLLSVTMDFGNGARVTTFSAPLDAPWGISGAFATNGTGVVSSVMALGGFVVDANYTTNGSGDHFGWFINGLNHVYQETGPGLNTSIFLDNVSGTQVAANWSASAAAVPEPGTLALVGLSLLGLVASRRRQH